MVDTPVLDPVPVLVDPPGLISHVIAGHALTTGRAPAPVVHRRRRRHSLTGSLTGGVSSQRCPGETEHRRRSQRGHRETTTETTRDRHHTHHPSSNTAQPGLHSEIARKGEKAPIQATQRWHIERTNAWHNSFNRLQRCYERRETVVDAFFDLADTIITLRSLIRQAWTTHRWDSRPHRRP
ncbi:Mobile element protein [Pseudonocardia sp. Ae717_Ps2]|nr:Mobile element protein [Pseudonocardia sp. Ae717_Ps2]